METKNAIRDFLVDTLKFSGGSKVLTDDYPLLEKGVVDSLAMLKIVAFIEDEFGVEIDEEELVSDNFSTIETIASLVDAIDS